MDQEDLVLDYNSSGKSAVGVDPSTKMRGSSAISKGLQKERINTPNSLEIKNSKSLVGTRGTVSKSALAQIDKTDSKDILSSNSHHDPRTPAEQLKTSGAVIGFANDVLLRQICDWAMFEANLFGSPALRLPYTFINTELNTDGWNNIPIPIVQSYETIKETFHNVENIFIAILRENKQRSEAIAKKFKQELTSAQERENGIKKQIEFLHRKQAEQMETVKKNAEEQLQKANVRMKQISDAAVLDRQKINSRFDEYTKSEEMQSWVSELVNSVHQDLQAQITKHHAEHSKKHQQLLNEHILIPGVIGDLEEHRNLKSYLLNRVKVVNNQQETIVKNAETQAADKVAELRKELTRMMTVLEKQIGSSSGQIMKEMDGMKKGLCDNHSKSLVEINFRFAALKQDVSNLNEQKKKDIELIHDDFLKIRSFDAKMEQISLNRQKDDKKFNQQDKQLEMQIKQNFDKLIAEIENTERRCKIDAQRVADLASKKMRGRGGSNRSGQQSSASMMSGSNPNLMINSSRKLIISPSQASQNGYPQPQSPGSEERRHLNVTEKAKTIHTMEPVEEDRHDSRMSKEKSRLDTSMIQQTDINEAELKTKKFQTDIEHSKQVSKRRSTTGMDLNHSRERGKKSALSVVDSEDVKKQIIEKIDTIGDSLLKQKPFIEQLTKKIEAQIKKIMKKEETAISKQKKPITGIEGCVLEDPDHELGSINIQRAKMDGPVFKPKMTLSERKSIIDNMRRENQKKFATVYSSDRNSPVMNNLDASAELSNILNDKQLLQDYQTGKIDQNTTIAEYLRNQENPLVSQRELVRNSLDPVTLENLIKNNKSDQNRNGLLQIISNSNEGFSQLSFDQLLNHPNAQITRIEPKKPKTTLHGKRQHNKASSSINAGFTSVLENMRGKNDPKQTNARLRSAYVMGAAAGGGNSTRSGSNGIKIYRETAAGVKYESLTIANKSPILNPQNHYAKNRFGFAQMSRTPHNWVASPEPKLLGHNFETLNSMDVSLNFNLKGKATGIQLPQSTLVIDAMADKADKADKGV